MEDTSEGFRVGWWDNYEQICKTEHRYNQKKDYRGDRHINIRKSASLKEKSVTDLYPFFSWSLFLYP